MTTNPNFTYAFETDEQERVAELIAVQSIAEMNKQFGGKSESEILNIIQECWPQDDSGNLAARIYAIVD